MVKKEQEVKVAVKSFLDAYANQDIDVCMSLISNEKPLLLIGTNEDEICKDKESLRTAFLKDFSVMADVKFEDPTNYYVQVDNTLASVIYDVIITYKADNKSVKIFFRYAFTFIKENNQWKICALLMSAPFRSNTYTF